MGDGVFEKITSYHNEVIHDNCVVAFHWSL